MRLFQAIKKVKYQIVAKNLDKSSINHIFATAKQKKCIMKNLLPFFAALILVFSMNAQDYGNRSMLDVAKAKISNSSKAQVKQVAGNDRLAVFEKDGGGFAIVKNDGKNTKVIAYSDNAPLDLTDKNPGFNWWMNAVSKASSVLSTTPPDPELFPARVEPLITTLWGQHEPFNYMEPLKTWVDGHPLGGVYFPSEDHYVVGCVGVAMAQYMYYYKWPARGIGQDSVTVKYQIPGTSTTRNVTFSVNFEDSPFEWDNMLDDYSGDYTDAQGQAVAQLCYYCSVAAQSTYDQFGTGSSDAKCIDAFINHFDYNDTTHYIIRSRYTEPEWMEMVYTELSNSRPIFYSARDINVELGIFGGHNFIIDGYDEDGLVHVNWGWHGQENGYYDIALLNPGLYTYDEWQAMYVGLYPNKETVVGDVNGDGSLTTVDITAIYNYLLNGDETYITTSDVNGDGFITSSDITFIYNILLGTN